jgi:hypothetical protein
LARARSNVSIIEGIGGLRLFLVEIEALAETLDTTSGIENALLASVEWMALRAHIHLEDRLCAANGEGVATGTRYRRLNILGMNSGFHGYSWALAALFVVAAIVWPRLGRALQRLLYYSILQASSQAASDLVQRPHKVEV